MRLSLRLCVCVCVLIKKIEHKTENKSGGLLSSSSEVTDMEGDCDLKVNH